MEFTERRKPHIARLPITAYPDYNILTNEVAVTIPLFYSPMDSSGLEYDEGRIRDVHIKGAIWVALSLINNTDLADLGVGIYFHIEDKIYEMGRRVFEAFGVPEKFIRVQTISDFQTVENINSPQYGKKYMFLDDDIVMPDRWVMMDSDAFVCSTGRKLKWYNCFRAFAKPSALNVARQDYDKVGQYEWWVQMCCLAAGMPFHLAGDLEQQERNALLELGVPPDASERSRWYVCSQIVVLPRESRLCEYIKRHYKRCHWDEGMLNVYQMLHEDISYLPNKLGGLRKYLYEVDYLNRDKLTDKEGYIAHLLPHNREEMVLLDEFYDEFYESLLPTRVERTSYSGIVEALAKTASDKESIGAHRYGLMYELMFDAVLMRQGRKLRICEIGVSRFGEGSLKAYQELDVIEEVVAIDIEAYRGTLSEKTTFYQYDAYSDEMVAKLKEKHDSFDIIIDDGSHQWTDQEYFIEHYKELLADGGILICEDVSDREFFLRMRKEQDMFCFDGWANRDGKRPEGPHNERILIYSKPTQQELLEEPEEKSSNSKIVKYTRASDKLQLFVLGIPYSRTSMDMITCAFVQRTWKLCKALHNLGHEIIHLGHVDSEVVCSEHIAVSDNAVLEKAYGYVPHDVVPEHSIDDHAFTTFAENAIPEIRKRAAKDALVLAMYGWGHKSLCDRLVDLPVHVVEPSIGYPDTFAKYRCYQSSAKMHFERGRSATYHKLLKAYPDDERLKRNSLGQALSEDTPDLNAIVLPNLYDFDHFKFSVEKDDCILFLGRVHPCKGLEIAFNLAEYTNTHLIVAGPGDIHALGFDVPKQVEYVGVADLKKRADLLEKAKAIICPSLYIEPGLGVHIEALFAGTPPITTNWGAPMDYNDSGRIGFRCQDFNDFVIALENIDIIDPYACREYAIQFSSERLSISYHDWFHRIIRHENAGVWSVDTDCKDLDWINRDLSESKINERIVEIQKLTGKYSS